MSWSQLNEIVREARAQADAEARAIPTECPVCGSAPLKRNSRGVLACDMGHWRSG